MKTPSVALSCFPIGLLLANSTYAQVNSSTAKWTNPFPVEPCHGIDIKDITVAELQRVRTQPCNLIPKTESSNQKLDIAFQQRQPDLCSVEPVLRRPHRQD